MKKTMLNCNISSFEVLSVVLFSALTFGSTGAVLAQSMAHQNRERMQLATAATVANVQPASNAANSARAAFQRADTNRDGQLSAEEARHLPAVSQRFEEMDTDRNGQLSLAEFDKGIQKY
ncbi:EF-hand domain-containing protein [Comamonas guangdongensis]|uniref:EF-hand domain-containing protein n=1 Tax=Comamonas guangdongensis TaxID=510515 RepID=A0ABV3ZTL1_9BURK